MSGTISFKIEGIDHLVENLRRIKPSVLSKHMRKGVTKGSRRISKGAKGHLGTVKERKELLGLTGGLREAMDIKVRTYGDGNVIGVVGPRNGLKRQIGVRVRGGKKSKPGDPIYYDPAKIAHLVEFGHGGPHPAPPHPFMRPALEENKEAAMDDIRDALEAGLVAELR